jgi:HDOD domain
MKAIPGTEVLSALHLLPFLSPNRHRLFSAVMQRGVRIESAMEWLYADPFLLSALMDAENPCESARSLIESAGMGKLRRLAMQLRLKQSPPHAMTWSAEKFLRQASVTAECVRSLADVLKSDPSGLAYTGGLFHDIGEALLAVSMPRLYDDIYAVSRITRREIPGIESELLGCDHAALSAMVLRGWNLPAAICDSVEYHHKPEAAPENARQMAFLLKEADDYFTSKSMACMAVASFSFANLSVTNTCMTYSPGASFAPSES